MEVKIAEWRTLEAETNSIRPHALVKGTIKKKPSTENI
jgi:hypothetical protein